MPPLENQRQELFCLQVIRGVSDVEAYKSAGYKTKYPGRHAHRLRKIEEVSARIRELQEAVADAEIMAVKERKIRLSRIARVELGHFLDPNGYPDEKKIAQGQGVVTHKRRPTLYGFSEELTVRDPVVAIKELNQMERIYTEGEDSKPVAPIYNINVVTPGGKQVVQHIINGDFD